MSDDLDNISVAEIWKTLLEVTKSQDCVCMVRYLRYNGKIRKARASGINVGSGGIYEKGVCITICSTGKIYLMTMTVENGETQIDHDIVFKINQDGSADIIKFKYNAFVLGWMTSSNQNDLKTQLRSIIIRNSSMKKKSFWDEKKSLF